MLLDTSSCGIPDLEAEFKLFAVPWAEHVCHGEPLAASLLAHPGVVLPLPGASVSA